MLLNKQIFVTSLILTAFAIIGAGLVAYTQIQTHERIEANDKQLLLNTLNAIIPAEQYDNDLAESIINITPHALLNNSENSTLYRASKKGKTVALIFNTVAPDGYSGKIELLVGIYSNGEVAGVRVVKHQETPGLGDAIDDRRSDWIFSFNNKSLDNTSQGQWHVKRDGGSFDQFTGATITPRAVVKAVHNTLLYFQQHRDELLSLRKG